MQMIEFWDSGVMLSKDSEDKLCFPLQLERMFPKRDSTLEEEKNS